MDIFEGMMVHVFITENLPNFSAHFAEEDASYVHTRSPEFRSLLESLLSGIFYSVQHVLLALLHSYAIRRSKQTEYYQY